MPLSNLPRRARPKMGSGLTPALVLALAGLGLAAAGCDRQAAQGTDANMPTEAELSAYQMGPAVDDLPGGEPAPIGVPDTGQDYGWIEDAYYVNHAFDDAAPDYAYGYDDTEFWGWESEDGWYRVAEPVGGYDRYYYYRPGEDRPFYVVDNGYGYGFSNGVLLVVYDSSGRVMPRDFVRSRADYAGRYLRRGREARAARREARRWQVAETRWERRHERLEAEQTRLEQAARVQTPWREYRRTLELAPPPERQTLDRERLRRQKQRQARQEDRQENRREARQEDRKDAQKEARQDARQDARQEARQDAAKEARQQTQAERREDRRERREDREDRAERRNEALTPSSPPPPVTVPARPVREDRADRVKGRSDEAHARNAERKAAKAREDGKRDAAKAERERIQAAAKAERERAQAARKAEREAN